MIKKSYAAPQIIRVRAMFEKNFLASAKAEGEDMIGLSDPESDTLGW